MPVANIKTNWNGGDLEFKDGSGNVIATFKSATRELAIASGAIVSIAGATVATPGAIAVKSADYGVQASDNGTLFVVTGVDKVMTLPATAAGLIFRFSLAAAGLSAGTGLQIAPAAVDKIMGDGFTAADNKAAVLAGSGDRDGDSLTLIGDGVDGWYIVAHEGTWTRAA